ncbi:hypothetical protein [Duffyella gerundensis]|uniref:hypothetical protein n=1 Tax=Duffyella TaxID=3026546 RepID=UPI003F6DDE33
MKIFSGYERSPINTVRHLRKRGGKRAFPVIKPALSTEQDTKKQQRINHND